jgi:FkbM family methyltransferase
MYTAAENAVLASSAPRRGTVPARARGALRLAGHALGEAWQTVRAARRGERIALALLLLRMRAKHWLGKLFPRWRFRSEMFFGRRMQCLDYYDLMCTAEIVFLAREYRFRPATEAPRIVDCGSNIGLSLLFFKREFPRCTIRAFEPDPQTFSVLRENVERNALSGIELHNLAVGAQAGARVFFRDPQRPGSVCMSLRAESGLPVRTSVETVRLSEMLPEKTDLLKLDVEGAELEVLHDLARSGKLGLVRAMVVEIHPGLFPQEDVFTQILALLEPNGFRWKLCSGAPGLSGNFTIYAERAVRLASVASA